MRKSALSRRELPREPRLIDFHPPRADMRGDVLNGLSRGQKELAPKYFYDQRGSHLFEDITQQPEYYLTRTEDGIMEEFLPEMAGRIGPEAAVIEFGSGTGEKIRRLLKQLEDPVACVPVEISRNHLVASAKSLAKDHPQLEVIAVCADFTQPFELPPISGARRKLVLFPGSTIGNFRKNEAVSLLKVMHEVAGGDGGLLLGTDLAKEAATLEAAYNDSRGVTAEFNLNLLRRINRELHADFELDAFEHRAVYNEPERRIEMYLVSQRSQRVTIDGRVVEFNEGEQILTEYSHKYDPDEFNAMAASAGLKVEQAWTDPQRHFSVHYLEPA